LNDPTRGKLKLCLSYFVNGYEIDSHLAILVWFFLLNKIILLICLCEELNFASYHSRNLASSRQLCRGSSSFPCLEINLLPDSYLVSIVCHALLTCLILASYHKNHAFFDHHLGPWVEGFTFVKRHHGENRIAKPHACLKRAKQ
jgi:hypothetical protein